MLRYLFTTATLFTPILFFGSTAAASTFQASVSSQFELLSIENLTTPGELAELFVTAETSLFDRQIDTQGGASASVTGDFAAVPPTPLTAGDGFMQVSGVFGATNGPNQSAFAFHQTNGAVSFVNASLTDTFAIEFSISYDLDTAVSTKQTGDDAFASALINVFLASAFETGGLVVNQAVASFPDFSDPGLALTDVFSLTLLPGESDFVDIEIDTQGNITTVPLPATAWLLLTAVAGLAATRRVPVKGT